MISVQKAWDEIARVAPSGKIDTVALSDAAGRILAEPILAQHSQPPRDVSAMDGYGVRFEAIAEGQTQFTVIGEVAAGQVFDTAITSTQAVRIFTGAPVSPGVTHVIVQEDTERDDAKEVRARSGGGREEGGGGGRCHRVRRGDIRQPATVSGGTSPMSYFSFVASYSFASHPLF